MIKSSLACLAPSLQYCKCMVHYGRGDRRRGYPMNLWRVATHSALVQLYCISSCQSISGQVSVCNFRAILQQLIVD